MGKLAFLFAVLATLLAPAEAQGDPRSGLAAPTPPESFDGPAVAPGTELDSVPLAITGAGVAGLGVVLGGIGGILASVKPSQTCKQTSSDTIDCVQGAENFVGDLLLGAGAVHVLTGVPMLVAGLWEVPSHSGPGSASSAVVRLLPTRVALEGHFLTRTD